MEASNWLVEWHDVSLLVAQVASAIGFDCAEMAFFFFFFFFGPMWLLCMLFN